MRDQARWQRGAWPLCRKRWIHPAGLLWALGLNHADGWQRAGLSEPRDGSWEEALPSPFIGDVLPVPPLCPEDFLWNFLH